MTLTKKEVLESREEFFKDVAKHLAAAPKPIDEKLEQVKFYFQPQEESLIMDVEYGDFYIEINPFFAGKQWPLAYSMWQIGDELRIAIILEGASELAPTCDSAEFAGLWSEAPMHIMARGAKTFLEWRFVVPGFHLDYSAREKYSLGMRHMHFRALKAIRMLAASEARQRDSEAAAKAPKRARKTKSSAVWTEPSSLG
jgi:hypothetical protein